MPIWKSLTIVQFPSTSLGSSKTSKKQLKCIKQNLEVLFTNQDFNLPEKYITRLVHADGNLENQNVRGFRFASICFCYCGEEKVHQFSADQRRFSCSHVFHIQVQDIFMFNVIMIKARPVHLTRLLNFILIAGHGSYDKPETSKIAK